uniref:Uncharacterized protein n=1 Tax=Wuchereria bancrofti TaxID=6293 RepID=A0A1I8ETP6_WUCBA
MILFVPLYIAIEDAIRLVMLYALRFENNTNSDIHGLVQLLRGKGIIRAVLDFGGSARWQNDLFDGIAIAMTKRQSGQIMKLCSFLSNPKYLLSG